MGSDPPRYPLTPLPSQRATPMPKPGKPEPPAQYSHIGSRRIYTPERSGTAVGRSGAGRRTPDLAGSFGHASDLAGVSRTRRASAGRTHVGRSDIRSDAGFTHRSDRAPPGRTLGRRAGVPGRRTTGRSDVGPSGIGQPEGRASGIGQPENRTVGPECSDGRALDNRRTGHRTSDNRTSGAGQSDVGRRTPPVDSHAKPNPKFTPIQLTMCASDI